jgi:hypothetical protein
MLCVLYSERDGNYFNCPSLNFCCKLWTTTQLKVVVRPYLPLHRPLFFNRRTAHWARTALLHCDKRCRPLCSAQFAIKKISVPHLRMVSAPNHLTTLYQLHRKFHIKWTPYRISISITITLSMTLASWPVPISATIHRTWRPAYIFPAGWYFTIAFGSLDLFILWTCIYLFYSFLFFPSRTGISYR